MPTTSPSPSLGGTDVSSVADPVVRPLGILAVCGSLRAESLNAAVLRTAAELCVEPASMTIYQGLGLLPYFNQDVEQSSSLPPEVLDLRARIAAADGVLIASPEYAHGTSGVLKNGLEWIVGGGELSGKPVAVVTASPGLSGGDRAQAWLKETLLMMGARILPESLPIPAANTKITDGRVTDGPTLQGLRDILTSMARAADRALRQ